MSQAAALPDVVRHIERVDAAVELEHRSLQDRVAGSGLDRDKSLVKLLTSLKGRWRDALDQRTTQAHLRLVSGRLFRNVEMAKANAAMGAASAQG
mgnify:CR=1 FL=1